MSRVDDETLKEWAEHRADDAGRLARELLPLRQAIAKIESMMGTAFGAGVYDIGPPAPGMSGTRDHSRNGYAQAVYEIARNSIPQPSSIPNT